MLRENEQQARTEDKQIVGDAGDTAVKQAVEDAGMTYPHRNMLREYKQQDCPQLCCVRMNSGLGLQIKQIVEDISARPRTEDYITSLNDE